MKKANFLIIGSSAILFIICVYALIKFIFPKPLSRSAADIANAYKDNNMSVISAAMFDAERSEFKWDAKKEQCIKTIANRVLKKIEVKRIHNPDDAVQAGQGTVDLEYTVTRTHKLYSATAVSYITPQGVKTPLQTFLNFLWVAEYRADVGDARPGQQILVEALLRGLATDQAAFERCGLTKISSDGIAFTDFASERTYLLKLRKMFADAHAEKEAGR